MIDIDDYMLLALEERRKHLRLSESCIDRGGLKQFLSQNLRGLIAYILDTTIPVNKRIHVCHACNNSWCSNPFHLYWGTPKENSADFTLSGKRKSPRDYTIAKFGLEKANELLKKAGNLGGRANKDVAKSKEFKNKLSKINSKIEWPSTIELTKRVRESSYTQVAKELGVSDVAVHDKLEKEGIRKISKFSSKAVRGCLPAPDYET